VRILTFFLIFYPLKSEAPVTSTFMEARSLHFHTGIDFSTGGRCGLPIYSPVDGYVVRLKVSYIGMGKAVYIQDSAQKVYVFAHLDEFAGPLDSIVKAQQLKTREYTQDLWLEHGRIALRKGELVGYSGKSGYGPPHLHFEMRRGFDVALNPLFYLGIRDSIPPEIKFIDVVPLSPESSIDGLPIPRRLRPKKVGDVLHIQGKFGIEISAVDYVNDRSYETAPYSFKLLVDGDTLFSVRFDSLNFREFGLSRSLYRPEGSHYSRALVRLYPPRGGAMGLESRWPGKAYMPGYHRAIVVVSDLAGNERSVSVPYRMGSSGWRTDEPHWDIVRDGFAVRMSDFGCLLGVTPGRTLTFNGQPVAPLGEAGGYRLFFLGEQGRGVISGSQRREFLLARVTPDSFFLPLKDFYLKASEGTALYSFYIFVMEQEDSLRLSGYSGIATRSLTLLPLRPPLRGRFEIGMRRESGRDMCLVRIHGEKAEFRGNSAKGYSEDLGTFVFLRDTVPPQLARLTGTKGGFYGRVEDPGSGIDPFSLEVTCDGLWIPADYDPETGELKYRRLEPGGHWVEVRVSDRAGNGARFRKYVVVK